MFGLMRGLLKDKEAGAAHVALADLHTGCVVGFGFMPQKNISGRRLPVTELNSYLFDGDSFISYRLESEQADVNLIVADGGDEAGSYLALSRRIKERFYAPLFSSPLPAGWFDLEEGAEIDVAPRVLGAPQGWLSTHYRVAVKTKGRLLEGDFRLRKAADRVNLSHAFDYVLLVNEENTHALEAERYGDGTLQVFATVYRPATDIGEITHLPPRAPKPQTLPAPGVSEAEVSKAMPVAETILTRIRAQEVIASEPSKATEVKAAVPEKKPESEASDLIAASAEVAPMHSKFGRIQPAPAVTNIARSGLLAFDTRLAGKLIDEAQRNKMAVSELIRKVIDLPADISEQVLIPFSLENAEYAELARRYQLSPGDHDAVRERILEELRQFMGKKK